MPTNEFAIESISWPLTPKSQILISPLELTKIFEGFTSEKFMKDKETNGYKYSQAVLVLKLNYDFHFNDFQNGKQSNSVL